LLAIGVIATLVVGWQVAAFANHTVSLAGSNFEIEDSVDLPLNRPSDPPPAPPGANLTVEHAAPSLDWMNVDNIRVVDAINGTGDNSFGQGSKEDTTDPTVVQDGIPPNKSDLRNFGVYLETNAAGRFLNVYWHRVQDPSGTTNMDFEFNANVCEDDGTGCSANGETPARLAGDVLIQYDLTNGGTRPELFLSKWVTAASAAADPDIPNTAGQACEASNSFPCWGDRTNLSASGDAAGSINNVPITAANSDGLGAMSARTFGEAQIDFDAIAGDDPCVGFGSAYLKSRSSDSFTAAMKDFTPPEALNFNNCGKVIIRKDTNPEDTDEDPATGPQFNYTTTNVATPATFSLGDEGVQTYTNVPLGSGKTVTETLPPPPTGGWAFVSVDCSASNLDGLGGEPASDLTINGRTVTFTLNDAADILDCTYTNELRTTSITSAQSFVPQDLATITGDPPSGFTGTVDFKLYSGNNCGATSGTLLADMPNRPLNGTTSGSFATTNNDGDDTDAGTADTIDGHTITQPGGTFSWKVDYVPGTDTVHPAQTFCKEVSTLTINNNFTPTP